MTCCGGKNGEQHGVDFVKVSRIFAMQDADFVGTISFDKVHHIDIRTAVIKVGHIATHIYTIVRTCVSHVGYVNEQII